MPLHYILIANTASGRVGAMAQPVHALAAVTALAGIPIQRMIGRIPSFYRHHCAFLGWCEPWSHWRIPFEVFPAIRGVRVSRSHLRILLVRITSTVNWYDIMGAWSRWPLS